MQKLLIATRNKGKFNEIREVFSDLPWSLLSLQGYEEEIQSSLGEAVEDGDTFEKNAYKKAKFYFDKTGLMVLAEDSGIIVDALKGEPGVKTRRFGAGEKASDEEWIAYFLNEMSNVPREKRSAEFVCVACLMGKDFVEYFRGETQGFITMGLEAPIKEGVPLSSCFRPEGYDMVYAALDIKQKNLVSHRGKAMFKVLEFLRKGT